MTDTLTEPVRVCIVGTGFAGLGLAIQLKQRGVHDFVVLERAHDVGGTWRDNTYPGAACDVPSHMYSFSFAPNPQWSRSFSAQPEIFDYLRGCADRFGIRPHIRFGTSLVEARWDDDEQLWHINTDQGKILAHVFAPATGALCEPALPDIPGIETFAGTTFHSARWDHDHELTGERVAVIGTGASAIQFVPRIQPDVAELHLFQRTPPWIVPRSDRDITMSEHTAFRSLPFTQKAARAGDYLWREGYVLGLAKAPKLTRIARAVARQHLARQVADPALRARLTPDYELGCKRVLISNDYYPALAQPNVDVVTDGIVEARSNSIVTRAGREIEVDTIIFGTGFHAADMPVAEHIRAADGELLSEKWKSDGAEAYKGTTVAGFPNLFFVIGPNTGLGHNSMVFMMECQFAYIISALDHLERNELSSVEIRPEVQGAYNDDLQRRLATTVWGTGGCHSWYVDEHGRNTTLWPGFTWSFKKLTRRFDAVNYRVRRAVPTPRPAGPAATATAAEEPVGADA